MNSILIIQDSLKIAKKTIMENKIETSENMNWWFWISIAQFGVIVFLISASNFKRKQSIKQKIKKESLDNTIDFDNIINSSFNSIKVYDELKVKCHPDRFPNDDKMNRIAENIFQEISKNKNNIKRLLELKEQAKQELNINF